MIQQRNCILKIKTTKRRSKGWIIIIEALLFVIVFVQCLLSANTKKHSCLDQLFLSALASSVNVGLLFATAFVNNPRPRRRRGEEQQRYNGKQQVNHPCSSSHIHDWFVCQASTLIMGATTSLFMMQQPPSKTLNDDQRRTLVANNDNTRIKKTDPLIKRKGLTYASDGITIVDSLFQNIADGTVLPGMSHSTHHTNNQHTTISEKSLADDANSTPIKEDDKQQHQLHQRRQLLYQDDYVAAFYPLDEGCPQGHILVVPRNRPLSNDKDEETNDDGGSEQQPLFLKTVKDLQPIKQDIDLLKHMKQVGYNVMLDHQKLTMKKNASNSGSIPATSLFGYVFHVPPFNSIDHLHLHVFGSKNERSSWKHYIKYPPFDIEPPWCIQFNTVLTSLERRFNNSNSSDR